MKIGFSMGRCVRDIVSGVVDQKSVMLIISRTKMPDIESINTVCNIYAAHDFAGLDLDECKRVAIELYNTGKLHQPRMFSDTCAAFTYPEHFIWLDLMPTVPDQTPAIIEAWSQYQMLLSLCSDDGLLEHEELTFISRSNY